MEHHQFIEDKPFAKESGISLYGNINTDGKGIKQIVEKFLSEGQPGDYVAINAYIMRDSQE